MPDKTEPKDLEMVLARLRKEWQELADLLTSQGKSQDRVIEVEKILFLDASGQYRGKISANPDGSADVLLSDRAGNAWARLGVNQDGEAFLELKDRKGESRLKAAVATSSPGSFAPNPAASQPLESPGASSQPIIPPKDRGEPLGESGSVSPPPTPDHDLQPGWDANSRIFGRLEKLARQHRRLKFIGAIILGVFGVILATQAYVLFRPHAPGLSGGALVVLGPNGQIRASLGAAGDKVGLDLWDAQGHRRATLGLGVEGTPGLTLYDRDQLARAELHLDPDGEPKFTLRDKTCLYGKTERNTPKDSGRPQPGIGAVSGAEEGTVVSPPVTSPAGPAAVSPNRDTEAEVELVGSQTSNKYHYPTCKWVMGISPGRMIKFKSAAAAQERHYVPCPVCKPPPPSR